MKAGRFVAGALVAALLALEAGGAKKPAPPLVLLTTAEVPPY